MVKINRTNDTSGNETNGTSIPATADGGGDSGPIRPPINIGDSQCGAAPTTYNGFSEHPGPGCNVSATAEELAAGGALWV